MRTIPYLLQELYDGVLNGTVTHVIANNSFREIQEDEVYPIRSYELLTTVFDDEPNSDLIIHLDIGSFHYSNFYAYQK